MKLNQRKNKNEQEKQQRELRSTVLEKYKNHIEHVIQDSQISFDSIETPGWTSLVNTEQSKFTKFHPNKKQTNQDPQNSILSRLNSLPKLNIESNNYSNIRLNHSSTKNKNLIVYGSVKFSQNKQNQTPRSKRSQRGSVTSRNSIKSQQKDVQKNNQNESSTNKFLNRFNKSRPNIFYSVEKSSDKKLQASRKRVQSVRSQPSQNLKQKIQQRLSLGNYKPSVKDQEFDRNICTQPNEQTITQRKFGQKVNFYSLNNQTRVSKDNKNEYFNRYMNKLSLRNKNQGSVKIFKKPNTNYSTNKQNDNSTKMNLIKGKQNKQNTPKRFNTITVHDYLYQDHIKLESKKKVQRMIEDSYNKATNFTFTPFISEKSNFLADSKFERESVEGKKQDIQKKRLENCFKKAQKKVGKPMKQSVYSVQEQISRKQKQKMSQMIRDRTLSKLFALLSNKTQQINEKTVQINIEKLPLSLIQLIEPFLTKIYQKRTFSYKQFMDIFSPEQEKSKQIVNLSTRKLVIIGQTQKFFRNLGLKKPTSISSKENEVNCIR